MSSKSVKLSSFEFKLLKHMVVLANSELAGIEHIQPDNDIAIKQSKALNRLVEKEFV